MSPTRPSSHQPPPARRAAPHLGALAVLLALTAPAAQAESSPWYLGVSESVTHDSNLYRLGDGVALPSTVKSRSDTSYATSLFGGLDQGIGRQRLTASASLRNYRYSSNDQLNYNGYTLTSTLDWSTVERVSGQLMLSGSRSLRRFDSTENVTETPDRNIETTRFISSLVRVGLVTALTVEGSLSRRTVDYSATSFNGNAFDQNVAGLGLRYRLGGATTVGLGVRQSRVTHPRGADNYDRQDIDLTLQWLPSALSGLNARISHSATDHDSNAARNFSGVTGELSAFTQVTGKTRLSTSLVRDNGQSISTFTLGTLTNNAEFDRTTTTWRFGADYAATGKISLNASVETARRRLDKALTSAFTLGGSDTTTTTSLGVRWQPTRSGLVGCDIGHERRSTDGTVSRPYSSQLYSCYGQITLQ